MVQARRKKTTLKNVLRIIQLLDLFVCLLSIEYSLFILRLNSKELELDLLPLQMKHFFKVCTILERKKIWENRFVFARQK